MSFVESFRETMTKIAEDDENPRVSRARMLGRGIVHGTVGSALGGIAGHYIGKKGGPEIQAGMSQSLGNLGGAIGAFHGYHRSAQNQMNEHHEKMKAKQGQPTGA